MLLAVLGVGLSTWRRKELPRSVSAMVYNLPVSEQYIWTLWLWVTACSLAKECSWQRCAVR